MQICMVAHARNFLVSFAVCCEMISYPSAKSRRINYLEGSSQNCAGKLSLVHMRSCKCCGLFHFCTVSQVFKEDLVREIGELSPSSEVSVSLCYNGNISRLTVIVFEAKGIKVSLVSFNQISSCAYLELSYTPGEHTKRNIAQVYWKPLMKYQKFCGILTFITLQLSR